MTYIDLGERMNGRTAAAIYLLMMTPLSLFAAMSAWLTTHVVMIPGPVLVWMSDQNTQAVTIAAIFGGMTEVYFATAHHNAVSWIEPPKGVGGIAFRTLANTVCSIMIVPFLLEWLWKGATFNAALIAGFMFTLCVPQLVPKAARKLGIIGEQKIELLGPTGRPVDEGKTGNGTIDTGIPK